MQNTAIDLAFMTVLVFAFAVAAWVRPDDRTKCWLAGWLCAFASFIVPLVQFHTTAWVSVPVALSADVLTMAGTFFVVSTFIRTSGRKSGAIFWTLIAVPTVLCLSVVTLGVQSRWILLAMVLLRQGIQFSLQGRAWRTRPGFSVLLLLVVLTTSAWMLFSVFSGAPRMMIPVILAEAYYVAGIDIWNKSTERTVGLYTTSFGLFAWGIAFPLAYGVHTIWPAIAVNSELWNIPKTCVAVGMILMVTEEEIHTARTLAGDYRLIFDNNPHPLWIFDIKTLQLVSANEAACAVHGYTLKEFLQLKLTNILHPEDQEMAILQARRPEPVPNRASWHIRKDGAIFSMDIAAHSVMFKGRPCRFILGLDVTTRDNLERRLEYQLGHDTLTGLANRGLFEQQLTDLFARTADSDEKLAIICVDIYHFKHLKDVYGLHVGDHCVEYVASVLNARMRATDLLARTGDDEFTIVLTQLTDATRVEELAAYLQESFRAPVVIQDYEIQLAFNLGLAICPDDGTDAMSLWQLAESALRQAQSSGAGKSIWASPELRAGAEKKVKIAASLSKPLDEGGFYLVYQPIYGFDGTVRSLEALLRFNHPCYGLINPLTVVEVAEETGLIEPLGQWVIEQVCRQLQTWMNQGERLVPIAINISALQLMRKAFAERLMNTLYEHAIDPKWIHLEVTETAAMDNLQKVSSEMLILSGLGCTFSIDDFGTGYSSLSRLHQLPISVVKIDRTFIEHLCEPNGKCTSFTIVRAILSMAHSLGMQVVAEGVETEDQLACLRNLECDFLQGYLLSRPIPPEQIQLPFSLPHPVFASVTPMDCYSKALADREAEHAPVAG